MTSKRSPLARRRGKNYAEKKALITKPILPLNEAVELLTKLSTAKFDATAEVHIRIGADR